MDAAGTTNRWTRSAAAGCEFGSFEGSGKFLLKRTQRDIVEGRSTHQRWNWSSFRQLDAGDLRAPVSARPRWCANGNVDYSVRTAYSHQDVKVKDFVDREVISAGAEVIARHARSYVAGDLIVILMHYLPLLEMKPGALDVAAAMQKAGLALLGEFRRVIEAAQTPQMRHRWRPRYELLERRMRRIGMI